MSFDVYVQKFQNGSRATFRRRHFECIFAARITFHDVAYNCVRLEYPGGGGGDVYIKAPEQIDGFTVNRPGGLRLFNDLFQLMKAVDAVLYWPDTFSCLVVVDASIIMHLPREMLDAVGPAATVSSGGEILAAIRRY